MEHSVLLLFAMFDYKRISDEFLDILHTAAAIESTVGHNRPMTYRHFGPALRRLTSLNLLEQRSHVNSQYFHVPQAIWDCLQAKLEDDRKQALILADAGSTLLCEAFKAKDSRSSDELKRFIGELTPHCRALSLFLKRISNVLPRGMPDLLGGVIPYLLDKAVGEARVRCTKQYWRQWMLSNRFPLSERTNTEEDGSQQADHPSLPGWCYESPGSHTSSSRSPGHNEMIHASIHAKVWCALRDSIFMAAIGQAWIEGIKNDMFELILANQGEYYTDAEVRAIADFVDKGGCAGVQNAILHCV